MQVCAMLILSTEIEITVTLATSDSSGIIMCTAITL